MIAQDGARRPVRRWLITEDGVRIRAEYSPGPPGTDLAMIMVHGFSGSIDKQVDRQVVAELTNRAPVVAIDMRGHGASSGLSTMGDLEVLDVAAAVRWARLLGFSTVVTVGFSMGAAVCVRHAGLIGGVDGVVEVSGPAFWNYRGTPIMRRLHFGVEHPVGRVVVRHGMRTAVVPPPWPTPWPPSPADAARDIPPTPFLIVHGHEDQFFPDEHPRALRRAAREGALSRGVTDRTSLWLRHFGHAEAGIPGELLREVVDWVFRECA